MTTLLYMCSATDVLPQSSGAVKSAHLEER